MSSRKKKGKSSQGSQSDGHFSAAELMTAFGFDFSNADDATKAHYSERLRGSAAPLSTLGKAVVTNGDTEGLNALARIEAIIDQSEAPTDTEYLSLAATLRRLQEEYKSDPQCVRDAKASVLRLISYRKRPRRLKLTMGRAETEDAKAPEGHFAWKPKDEASETAIETWKAGHPGQAFGPDELNSCLTASDSRSFHAMLNAAMRKQ